MIVVGEKDNTKMTADLYIVVYLSQVYSKFHFKDRWALLYSLFSPLSF